MDFSFQISLVGPPFKTILLSIQVESLSWEAWICCILVSEAGGLLNIAAMYISTSLVHSSSSAVCYCDGALERASAMTKFFPGTWKIA